ncbi:unnamed protein product [Lota lota]
MGRKKTTMGRKKTTMGRKKTTMGRKKTTMGRVFSKRRTSSRKSPTELTYWAKVLGGPAEGGGLVGPPEEADQLASRKSPTELTYGGKGPGGVPLRVEVLWDPQKRRTSSPRVRVRQSSPTGAKVLGGPAEGGGLLGPPEEADQLARGGPARVRVRQSSPTGAKVLGGPAEGGGLVGPPEEADQLASWGVPLRVEVLWDPQKRRTSSRKSPTELTYWGKGPGGVPLRVEVLWDPQKRADQLAGVPLRVEVLWDPQKRRTSSRKSPTELTYWGKGPEGSR